MPSLRLLLAALLRCPGLLHRLRPHDPQCAFSVALRGVLVTDTCRRGHPRTEENTYMRTRVRPGRKTTVTAVCRPCQAAAQRLSEARRWPWERVHAEFVALLTDVRLGMSLAQRRAKTGL